MDARTAGGATDAARIEPVSSPAANSLSALAVAARDGDRDAEERLWERARPWLVRTGLAFGAPAADVPDLVQDTLLAGHRHLSRFDSSRGSLEGWLGSILVRRVRNGARSRGRRARILNALRVVGLPFATRADATSAGVESRLVLDRLIRSLTDSQRDVVALYEIGDLPAEEVARILGITAAGVRSIARDARRKLAEAAEARP